VGARQVRAAVCSRIRSWCVLMCSHDAQQAGRLAARPRLGQHMPSRTHRLYSRAQHPIPHSRSPPGGGVYSGGAAAVLRCAISSGLNSRYSASPERGGLSVRVRVSVSWASAAASMQPQRKRICVHHSSVWRTGVHQPPGHLRRRHVASHLAVATWGLAVWLLESPPCQIMPGSDLSNYRISWLRSAGHRNSNNKKNKNKKHKTHQC
jgi:hypothetical protein